MFSGTYAVAQLMEALGERKTCQNHTSYYQQQNMQVLNDRCVLPNTALTDTHVHKHSLFPPPSAHSWCWQQPTQCFGAAKRFIKTSKKIEHSISPAASVWEDFYGNLELDFLCNLYSWVIFSHPIQSAEAAFFVFLNKTEEMRMSTLIKEFGNISKFHLKPTSSVASSITCCLHSTVHPLSSAPGFLCYCKMDAISPVTVTSQQTTDVESFSIALKSNTITVLQATLLITAAFSTCQWYCSIFRHTAQKP